MLNRGETPMTISRYRASCGCTRLLDFEPVTLSPGQVVRYQLTMDAPTSAGEEKTKVVIFTIEGQVPVKVPVHLNTSTASG